MSEYIILNGEKTELNQKQPYFVSDLIKKLVGDHKGRKIAIAINFKLVCKSEWSKTKIKENDKIEIVSPFTGG
tara:strand:+ start:89 stop:307 length:219 start_codon:yes stop_codon:yes gene_type:complete